MKPSNQVVVGLSHADARVELEQSPDLLFAIDVRNLTKTYPRGVRALDGLSFSVERGTIFGLLGPNGAGKSTAIKILTTLSAASSGEARVAGFDVAKEPDRVRSAIGCVAQRSGVDPEATGRENLILQGRIHGLRGSELKKRVDALLEHFRLTGAANLLASTYSGGMQRKLDIAMGLIHRPQVLFLDEPTTGLDPEARAELWEEIARLSQSEGLTILLTTHYLEEADRLARRLAIVDRGRVVIEGTPEGLKGELHGDSVEIELPDVHGENRIRGALGHVPGIRDIAIDEYLIHARADQGATALPVMLAALEADGIRALSVKVSRPSLEDVYLRYTGRTFRQAEEGGAK
jgi:ABC-2 type transport system ATP-binding protein